MKEKLVKIKELKSSFLKDTVLFGNEDSEVSELKAFHSATKQSGMTYILKTRLVSIEDLLRHSASTFITDYLPSEEEQSKLSAAKKNLIYSEKARLQMAKLSTFFDYEKQALNEYVPRHPYCQAQRISFYAHIEDDVEIGEGTKIYSGAVVYRGVKIGKNCIIHSGAIIGADGFGYEQDETGDWFKIAHLGGIVIGDNVEIGANACIDRGTLGDTIIEDGAKIDNLVHIAHNVHIKKNAMIIANAMVAGSVVVGEGAWIAPSSSIREGRKIGDKALVGLGSVVVKDVEPGTVVLGNPARVKE